MGQDARPCCIEGGVAQWVQEAFATQFIEKLAREKLGYVRPGETAYVVLDPPESETRPLPQTDDLVFPEEPTWVDRLWDFVTGADLGDR